MMPWNLNFKGDFQPPKWVEHLPVQVSLVVVHALVHRLGPVRIPHGGVVVEMNPGVHDFRWQVILQGHRLRLSHPCVNDAAVLGSGIGLGSHLAHHGGIGTFYQPGDACACTIKSVAVILAGDGAGEQRLTPAKGGHCDGGTSRTGRRFCPACLGRRRCPRPASSRTRAFWCPRPS